MKWDVEDPNVNFVIESTDSEAHVNHFGVQVETADQLEEVAGRMSSTGHTFLDVEDCTCCYADLEKAWVMGPIEDKWEVFLTHSHDGDEYGSDRDHLLEVSEVTEEGEAVEATQGSDDDGDAGFLATHLPEFVSALGRVDEALESARTVDSKTDELIRFALSVKARSEPCVRKHFRGALAAGATEAEIGYVFALTMREAAGADDCWTHSIIGDLAEGVAANCCG